MKYTQLQKNTHVELNEIKKSSYDAIQCSDSPSHFAHHVLGITPYRYQHMILRRFRTKVEETRQWDTRPINRLAICKSRQIGISICLACLAIWYVVCSNTKTGWQQNCKVGIISRSDEQAKKLMAEIQKMVWNGREELRNCVRQDRKTPLNKKEIHFKSGWIKCFPPTDSCRGETFDLVIVDEAAFINDAIFHEVIEPTVAAVNGKIVISSTPNGMKGYFYELFDPMDVLKNHEYERYWFHWKMCENELQKKLIRMKLRHSKETGNIKQFDQEHNAKFTVDEEAFFEDGDVEKGIDRSLSEVYEYHDNPCVVAIDYGMTDSATAITVTTMEKNTIKLLFQFAQKNFDTNLLTDKEWEHSVYKLKERYSVANIVTDDCANGFQTNKFLETNGFPLLKFSFRSDQALGERNRGYYIFRSALKKGKIKYPNLRGLMAEMKCLQEVRLSTFMRIKAPSGYMCDKIDAFMMAAYPFLSEEGGTFTSYVSYVEEKLNKEKQTDNFRRDIEWEEINNKQGMYSFYTGEGRGRKKKVEVEDGNG